MIDVAILTKMAKLFATTSGCKEIPEPLGYYWIIVDQVRILVFYSGVDVGEAR